MTNLTSFLASLGFDDKGHGEWLFQDECWYCSRKQKVFFNVNKMIGFCVACEKTISLQTIAVELAGVRIKEIQSFIDEHQAAERAALGFREAMLNGLLGDGIGQAEESLPEIPLPKEYRSLQEGADSVVGRKAIAYLMGRGFDLDVLYRMCFGYCSSGLFDNRVIVPFWEDGKIVYWQARDFTGKVPDKDKIRNPELRDTAHGKSDVLFNYDGARELDHVILTESWGSALATGKYGMGLNGKNMSGVQLRKLISTKAHTLIIMLDHGKDETEAAWKIAAKLHTYKRVMLAFLPYGDPNEVTKEIRLQSLRDAKIYSVEEHIAQRVNQLGS